MNDTTNMTDGDLLAYLGTNAELWAAEFAKRFPGAGLDPALGEGLHGWLCNAIEAGRSAGQSDTRRVAVEAADYRAAIIEWVQAKDAREQAEQDAAPAVSLAVHQAFDRLAAAEQRLRELVSDE